MQELSIFFHPERNLDTSQMEALHAVKAKLFGKDAENIHDSLVFTQNGSSLGLTNFSKRNCIIDNTIVCISFGGRM